MRKYSHIGLHCFPAHFAFRRTIPEKSHCLILRILLNVSSIKRPSIRRSLCFSNTNRCSLRECIRKRKAPISKRNNASVHSRTRKIYIKACCACDRQCSVRKFVHCAPLLDSARSVAYLTDFHSSYRIDWNLTARTHQIGTGKLIVDCYLGESVN